MPSPFAIDLELYGRGVDYFNRGEFFEAHETWEDIWRPATGPEKRFLQGLIQIAVALHHHSTGNLRGAESLLERGCRNLDGCPEIFGGVQLPSLLHALKGWRLALAARRPVPALPKLETHNPA